jgi:histidine triad (HIT) family protein
MSTTPTPLKPACVFCQIVERTLPAEIVYEDQSCLAFLDQRPLFPGHTLLVPRQHVQVLAELPDELLAPLMAGARLLARVMEAGLGADGSFVAANNKISQSVPHLHIHVVPRRAGDGLRGFFWPRQRYASPEEMIRVGSLLRDAVEAARDGSGSGRRTVD